MGITELLILAVALSMDAFAVSVCLGLKAGKLTPKCYFMPAVYFGAFQAAMPIIGYFAGVWLAGVVSKFSNILAFVLLLLIGFNMIKEALCADTDEVSGDFSHKAMFFLAVATSIDALSIGFTFAILNVNLFKSVSIIGFTTFLISLFGVKIGSLFGDKNRKYAGIAGGIILILIGIKILFKL